MVPESSWDWPVVGTCVSDYTNLSLLRRMALNLLPRETTAKGGIAARRPPAGGNNGYLLKGLSNWNAIALSPLPGTTSASVSGSAIPVDSDAIALVVPRCSAPCLHRISSRAQHPPRLAKPEAMAREAPWRKVHCPVFGLDRTVVG